MPFQDRLTHAAAVAKWKIDQQGRLMRIQGEMRDFENQIRSQKSLLADTALMLFNQKQLTQEELAKICTVIASLDENLKVKQAEHETVRQEQPPPDPSTYNTSLPASGLKCPQCGRLLAGRFCPEHGVEGVPVATPQPPAPSTSGPDSAPAAEDAAPRLVCPTCRRVLMGRFCPEHGVEGIPG